MRPRLCRHVQQQGFDVTYLPVGPDGILDLGHLRSAFRPDTGLVSVIAVNNEIGWMRRSGKSEERETYRSAPTPPKP